MVSGAKTDTGKVRDNNQDVYFVSINEEVPLFIVADGMGGHKAGEVASNMAMEIVRDEFFNLCNGDLGEKEILQLMKRCIEEANNKIYLKSIEIEEFSGMGTTITIAYIKDDTIFIGHVGDSRGYIIREEDIIQITDDHTLVNELVKNGSITTDEAKNHPQRNVITRAVGTSDTIEVDFIVEKFEKENILLLCSDGLTSMIKDSEIKDVLISEKDIQEACEKLVDLSNEKGGHDNITVIAIRF